MAGVYERRWVVLAALGLLAAALAVVPYGLDPSDEGYIVYPAAQVAAGAVPYRDIHSLYTPLAWYLHAALFKVVGVELVALRVLFAVVAVSLGVGIYALARQLVPARWAALSLVTYALVFPLPQNWAPYPAWYALGGLLLALLAMSRWLVERRGPLLLLAVGVGCGLAFGTKSNLGLFGLITFCGFLGLQARTLSCSAARPQPSPRTANTPLATHAGVSRGTAPTPSAALADEPSVPSQTGTWLAPAWFLPAAQVLGVAAVSLALWTLLRGAASPGQQAVMVGTFALAGLVLVEAPARVAVFPLAAEVLRRWGWILLGFLAVTLPWYVLVSLQAGWGLTFDTIFRAGAENAWAVHGPLYLPGRDALEAMVWIAAAALGALLLGWLGRRGRLQRRPVALALGAAMVLALALLAWRASAAGESLGSYLLLNVSTRLNRTAREETDLLSYVPFVVTWLGLGLLAWRRWQGAPVNTRSLRLRLLVWFLGLFLFQYYPRASYLHVLFMIGPFLVLLDALRADLWTWLRPLLPGPTSRAASLALLLVFPALMLPSAVRARIDTVERQDTLVPLPHAGVGAFDETSEQLQFVARGLANLPPGEPIFAYPALPMVYLLTDHPNPTRQSYLPAGYLDEADGRAVVERLEATQTRYVVWDQQRLSRWGLFPSDRPLADYIWTTYAPVGSHRGWILLERRSP